MDRNTIQSEGVHRGAPFAANVELTDLRERLVTARTTNLSLFGCYVSTTSPFPEGTKVTLRITHDGASFMAWGKVLHLKPNSGMGVAFANIEPTYQTILEKWIASLL